MSEEATFSQAAQDIFDTLAEPATFTPLVGDPVENVMVNPEFEVEFQPAGESQVWDQVATIEYLLSEVGKEADPGDTFLIAAGIYAGTYTVKVVLENDGRFVKATVK
ncbi:hypothetical protein LCGC14_0612810 [marine sediment metagenome]|uniref:Uncharacterized protein n=1 Tax=marine sediment metagenome TaxID=412755 RepID=A0A0F9RRH3_9ZZZZ